MHPVLNIFYENEIVDTLLLNNELKDNKITRNRLVYTELFVNDDENIEYEVFETNSDAWDESFDFSESQDSEPDSEENIFLKAAEDILGAPIKFEADHDSPDSWDDDEEIISSSSLEDEFLNNIKDENIKNKNDDDDDHDEWDDEIDLGEDE